MKLAAGIVGVVLQYGLLFYSVWQLVRHTEGKDRRGRQMAAGICSSYVEFRCPAFGNRWSVEALGKERWTQ